MDTSGAGLFLSLAIGAVGAGLFIYGKKQARLPQMLGGLLLALYPYFVSNLWVMAAIAAGLIAAIGVAVRLGG